MPSISAARKKAIEVKCASNLRQIGQAVFLYANDNKGEFVPDMIEQVQFDVYQLWWGTITFSTATFDHSDGLLSKYWAGSNGVSEVTLCPAMHETFRLWDFVAEDPRNASLAFNHYGVNTKLREVGLGKRLDMGKLKNSARIAMFADAAQPTTHELAGLQPPEPWLVAPDSPWYPTFHARHTRESGNVVFMDGHVEARQAVFFDDHPSGIPLADRRAYLTGDLDLDGDPTTLECFLWDGAIAP